MNRILELLKFRFPTTLKNALSTLGDCTSIRLINAVCLGKVVACPRSPESLPPLFQTISFASRCAPWGFCLRTHGPCPSCLAQPPSTPPCMLLPTQPCFAQMPRKASTCAGFKVAVADWCQACKNKKGNCELKRGNVRREELASSDCSELNNGSAPVNPGCQTCATVATFCDSNPNVDTSANITLGKRKIERYEREDFWRRKATGEKMGAQKARAAQLARKRQRLVAKQARFSAARRWHAPAPLLPRVRARVLACSPLCPSPAHPLGRRMPGRTRP